MLMKKSVGLAILMVFLLLYPRFAAEGARYGLLLWYTSVVPSLFPFMVLSSLIVSSGGVSLLMKPVRAFLGPWLPLSENGCYTLISGLLCGCPMGAKTCGDFVREGKLSVQEGRFLMTICNHPSPMFLLALSARFLRPECIPPAFFFPFTAAPSSGCPGKEDLFSCPACSCVQRLPATDPDSSGPGYGDPGRSRDPLPHRRLPDAVFHRDRIFTPRTVAPRLSPDLPYGRHGDDHRESGKCPPPFPSRTPEPPPLPSWLSAAYAAFSRPGP